MDRSAARDILDELFDEIDVELEKLDRLMTRYENKDSELFNMYVNARNLRDKATRKREKPEAVSETINN